MHDPLLIIDAPADPVLMMPAPPLRWTHETAGTTPSRDEVAQALWVDGGYPDQWDDISEETRERWRQTADAVLALFSQPTPDRTAEAYDAGYLAGRVDEFEAAAPVVPERPQWVRLLIPWRGHEKGSVHQVSEFDEDGDPWVPFADGHDGGAHLLDVWWEPADPPEPAERPYRAAKAAADALVAAGDGPADVLRILAFAIERAAAGSTEGEQ